MRKKLFTLLLVLVASVGAMFAKKVQIGDLYYNLDATNQTAEVTSQNSSKPYWSKSITTADIPSSVTYNSVIYSVTSIGSSAFEYCSGLTSVTIPNSVTSIGKSAFSDCSGLTSVTIPNSVTSIGDYAFFGCSSLTSVTIPNSVTSIGKAAFSICSGLTSVTIPNSVTSIGKGTFSSCSGLTSVTIPNSVTSIGESAFSDCSSLTSMIIGNSVTSIGYKAFYRCSSLTSVRIGNSVTSIGGCAFYSCSSLTSVTIPNSVTSIESWAFYGCSSLTSVTIPNSVKWIGNNAFSGCSGLKSMIVESGNSMYDSRNNCNAIIETSTNTLIIGCQNTIIPSSVTSIGYGAFLECTGLTSVTIPNSVTSMGYEAFKGCNGLTFVTIPSSVTRIGNSAFRNCSSLTSVTIPNSVTSIGYKAFYGCSSLISVTIPNSVTSIEYDVFRECTNLTSVTIPNSVTSIGEGAFLWCSSLTSVTIPNSVTSIGEYAFLCSSLKYIISLCDAPPTIKSSTFPSDVTILVNNTALENYKNATYWKNLNIKEMISSEKIEAPTSVVIDFAHNIWALTNNFIASLGILGGEQQPGNVLEYIGLEPNSEYKDIPVVLTSNTGETETVNVSFTTTALELTTKPSKPVSSTTAILLAETNMSDAETSCGFEYKRNDAPADMEGNKVYCPIASGQMAGRLKGLKDDVYYKYRAFYQSAAGNMFYGDWQYIFTGDVAVEFDPILYTYGATVVRENEATISGYVLAGSEDFTEQGFEYWAESRTNSGANAPHRVPAALNEHFFVQASGISLRVTLNNLDAGTVYKYRVYGKVGDQYYYGSEQSFTTQGTYEGDDSEAIEEIQIDPQSGIKAQKILRNGQIFILSGDKVYNAQGALVK